MSETNFVQKSSNKFYCKICDYSTSRNSQYSRHLTTQKHKRKQMEIETVKKVHNCISCKCGRLFQTNSGLWKHKKKCNFVEESAKTGNTINYIDTIISPDNESQDYKMMFFKIMEENSEFKDLLIIQQKQIINQQKQIGELIPKVGNNNNNNIKQKFNINIFLNEQCKDALNMNDFLKQIEVTLKQLDITKNKGQIEGLSNVFIENMNKLSVYERPLHCTDTKRETIYIKENDVWEKDPDKTRIRAAIKDASATQYKNMQKWIDMNPDYMEVAYKQDYFIHMVKNCGKNLDDIDDKIIKKICTSSYIKAIMNENN